MQALSVGSMLMGAAGTLTQAKSSSAGASHQAQQATVAAQSSRINANETDAYYRDDLRRTLANIAAIRASVGAEADTPTSQAINDESTRVSDEQRTTKVTGMRVQAKQSDDDAKFYTKAARSYITSGYLSAGAGLVSGASKGSVGQSIASFAKSNF